jgi:hypothetical protein
MVYILWYILAEFGKKSKTWNLNQNISSFIDNNIIYTHIYKLVVCMSVPLKEKNYCFN